METITLETIALLPDGRPMLSFGTRGQDPDLAGGLTSAVYSFTKEIDLRKTPSDGLKIDVPGGGKLILRRALVMGREVFVSVIVRGVVNEQILSILSEFGHILGEVVASIEDWTGIRQGQFSPLFSRKADIYLETLKRWRATTSTRPLISIEYRDVIRRALSVLGKTISLSDQFLRTVSNQQLVLREDELATLVAKEVIVLTSDQELFLALCTKDDHWKTAFTIAEELKAMKSQAQKQLQTVFEEVKKDFFETVASSINEQTAFFRLPERRATWINEVIQAVYKRMSKRSPLLLLAHPLLSGIENTKGLREMATEFIEAFLAEKGPAGKMKKLVSNTKVKPGLTRLLNKFIEKCGPSFNEDSACLFVNLVEPQQVRETLLNSTGSDGFSKSFVNSMTDILSKISPPSERQECKEIRNKLHAAIVESYAQILEEILVGRDIFLEEATAVRDHLLRSLATFQVIASIDGLAQHKWKAVRIKGNIPKYVDLLSAGLLKQAIKKEDGTLVIEGEKHTESSILQDPLLLRKLWGNWYILNTALKEKMVTTLRNEFQSPLQIFLRSYLKTAKENLNKLEEYVKSVGSGALPTVELSKPEAERKLYEPLRDECEKIYDSIMDFYEKLKSFVEKSVQEISSSEGAKRAALAKQILYSTEKIEKQYLSGPAENVGKQIDVTLERAAKKLDAEIASAKDRIDSSLKLSPSFIKYSGGILEEPILAIRSYKLPLTEDFFEGGYPELLHAYASIVLGLGVPENIVLRGVSQLKRQKAVPSILRPLTKVKEANWQQAAPMHMSEYVRMFVENTLSLLTQHVNKRYATIERKGPLDLGVIPVELMDEPVDYLGKPAGVEWSKDENIWALKMYPPERLPGEADSIQKWINGLLTQLIQKKHGVEFETLIKAGKLLGPEVGTRIENGIQRIRLSLTPSIAPSNVP
nr:hypothetical protein [Candidatus Njordarchaeum guaymaensis]